MKRLSIIVFSLLIILSACSDKLPIETDMSEDVKDFTFTTQHEEKLSLEDLKGTWWISNFIFTNCTSVCLPMSSNMSTLQDKLQEENIEVELVSFSVDPDHDTPDVLQKYGEEYEADFANWTFLTGYDFQTIKEFSIKSFRAPLKEPETGSDQVMHDTRFFLITPEGEIVKGYDGVKTDSIDDILQDLKLLEDEELL